MTVELPAVGVPHVAYQASWVPRDHIERRPAGVDFDAVRVTGLLGLEVACALDVATVRRSGPVIREDPDGRDETAELLFLVPVGEGLARRWPPGVRVFGFPTQAIRVPALWGNTYPLRWRSTPTRGAELVDAELLHRALCEITTWSPLPGGT
ncbi:hypothetical protein [Embleya sp. AB8]|uniref:hypothetical protein n=1 Tax=Embleya sp. AB8 TaxID=3156304 RepID=UPI003C710F27